MGSSPAHGVKVCLQAYSSAAPTHPAPRGEGLGHSGIFTVLATSARLSSIYLEETGLSCFKSSLPLLVVREWTLLWLLYQPGLFEVAREHSWEAEERERERRRTEPWKDKGHLGLWSKALRTSAASGQSSRAAALPPWLRMRTCTPAPREQRPASCAGDREAPKAPPPGTGWQWRCQ